VTRRAQTILGPILNPRAGGGVDFLANGAISCDAAGNIDYVGDAAALPPPPASSRPQRTTTHFVLPPFLDAHTHVPQHPIRGHFMDGVGSDTPQGRLIAGLDKNVFPAEGKFADLAYATRVIDEFARDTLANGVVGGSAYLTVHRDASHVALERLGQFWHAGLVLMEMNCPEYLRVDPSRVIDQMRDLAGAFGRRYVVTDRFAVAVGSELRRHASWLARERGLRTQTHLNEQRAEKELVETQLYPHYASYTDVYFEDGLLQERAILAHCIHMRPEEWDLVAKTGSVVAHCPTSNTLLCSGIMPLDEIASRGIEYAICTDVGASPTTSMLAEMAQYLKVHAGRSDRATPREALYRATLAPAKMLGLDDRLGSFDVGKPLSFIEVLAASGDAYRSADDAILRGLLEMTPLDEAYQLALDQLRACRLSEGPALDLLKQDIRDTAARLEKKVMRVTLAGEQVWSREGDGGV
jgi:guanine deaminase